MTLASGTRLGPYEVTGDLGAGGMGEVYRGRDATLNREVAIKVLPASLASNPERLARFKREAQVLASLNHPNIAHVYGFEAAALENGSTVHFLAMELVEGEDLAERLKRGAIPVDEAIAIAKQIAEGLEEAHERGIVHRDLKPANVKVTPEGKVKVLDFGLAKALDNSHGEASGAPRAERSRSAEALALSGAEGSHSPTMSRHATEAGMIMGTAAYMSPEQARGKTVDKRADIWSFGVVLFEMLTGQRLFAGETVSDTLAAVLTRDPDWTALPPLTPEPLRVLLHSTLVRDPRQRLRDIGEARRAIEAPAESAGPSKRETGRSARAAWAVAGITTVVASWLGVQSLAPRAEHPRPVRFTVGPPEGTAWNRFTPQRALVSPDGVNLALIARDIAPASETGAGPDEARVTGRTLTRVWIRRLDSLRAQPLAGTEGVSRAFWSPDSRSLAFDADGTLKTIDVASGRIATVCPVRNLGGGSWGPGNQIIFDGQDGLYRVDAGGGEPVPLSGAQSESSNPVQLRDGRLLYTQGVGLSGASGGALKAYVSAADGSGETLLFEEKGSRYSAVVPTAAGDLLYVRDHALIMRSLDPDRPVVTAGVQVAEGVGVFGPGRAVLSVSDNGVLVYGNIRELSPSQPTWFSRDGRVLSALGAPGQYYWLALSPDGTRVAAERVDPLGEDAVWIMDSERGVSTRLTIEMGAWTGVWAPDSRSILYSTADDGGPRLTVQRLDARGPGALLGGRITRGFPTDWSRDGRAILFGLRPDSGDIHMISPEPGSEPQPYMATTANEDSGRISPDGRLAAFVSDESGRGEVYIASFPTPGERTRVSSGGGTGPRWRGDSKEFFYLAPDGAMMAATVTARDGRVVASPPKTLFRAPALFDGRVGGGYDVSADGKRFLMNLATAQGSVAPITVVLNWKSDLASQGKP